MFKFVQIILKQRHFRRVFGSKMRIEPANPIQATNPHIARDIHASIVDWQFRVFIAIADSWQIVRFPSASKKESRISGFHGWMFLGFKSKEKKLPIWIQGIYQPKRSNLSLQE